MSFFHSAAPNAPMSLKAKAKDLTVGWKSSHDLALTYFSCLISSYSHFVPCTLLCFLLLPTHSHPRALELLSPLHTFTQIFIQLAPSFLSFNTCSRSPSQWVSDDSMHTLTPLFCFIFSYNCTYCSLMLLIFSLLPRECGLHESRDGFCFVPCCVLSA